MEHVVVRCIRFRTGLFAKVFCERDTAVGTRKMTSFFCFTLAPRAVAEEVGIWDEMLRNPGRSYDWERFGVRNVEVFPAIKSMIARPCEGKRRTYEDCRFYRGRATFELGVEEIASCKSRSLFSTCQRDSTWLMYADVVGKYLTESHDHLIRPTGRNDARNSFVCGGDVFG